MRRTLIACLLLASLVIAGCGGTAKDAFGPKPAKPKPIVEQDFENPKDPAWGLAPGQKIVDGELVLTAKPQDAVRSSPAKDRKVDDVSVETTATSSDIKGDEATYGVICRWRLPANGRAGDYYAFTIAPNGYASIGTTHRFLWQTAKPISAIKKGAGAVNRIRAVCVGAQLSFYVNDKLVQSVEDPELTSGDVAVTLENYSRKHRVTAHFDDVLVSEVPDN